MTPIDPLSLFLAPVQQWFRTALGTPTEAQRLGWPAIAAGQHTLILAPTGSGKTLAAFLACLDALWRQDPLPRGVRVLYVSPLKALNNDIHRNLQAPLAGVAAAARALHQPLPVIEAAVRTGDTPPAARQQMVRKPPHVLITTPESLHLLLTSNARDTLRHVTHCIVDEIHALCPNKRGVFLALLLERLEALNPHGFVRIGLSATQRPLTEVANFLGGSVVGPDGTFTPRPVTIIDAGLRKDLDLRVVSPVEHFGLQPERSIWPSIYRLLTREIHAHRSTIIFANNRRSVERITAFLNADPEEEGSTVSSWTDVERNAASLNGAAEPKGALPPPTQAIAPPPQPVELARAHHGSIALEVRQQTEAALKEGRLPAVVATGSLELGIDMGAVDLVCQVESPGGVARGLQRVGRAGHVVGQKSKGRLIPVTTADLLELAVLAHEMAGGRVEALRVPANCLDVLAQQVIALAALDPWDIDALYRLVRQAYPFRDLSPQAFEAVLEMISGRFRLAPPEKSTEEAADSSPSASPSKRLAALQPRVSWDRVHQRLLALPGSRQLALVNGGTIPDTGQYAAYTASGVRIGELDEEFVYERRIGDAFLLGTNAWRIENIEADRVLVVPAEGSPALVPFWRGEKVGRTYDLGLAIGKFLRALTERLDAPDLFSWLENDYLLDTAAARNLCGHVRRQLLVTGCLPTDRTLLFEASRDQLGDWQVIVLNPLGGRLNLALKLAITARLRQRLGYDPQCMHHDDGILLRLADTDEPPLDLLEGLTPENVEALIVEQLGDSALFTLRFRQNAARALLLPRARLGKRAPLWLQRLRGRDLLQVARHHADFPIVAETFRECLHDHLDLPHLQQLLRDVASGEVQIVTRRAETPSPFASGLLFNFTSVNMYQHDRGVAEDSRSTKLDTHLLEQLIAPERNRHLLDPRAIHQVERRLRGLGQPPRSVTETAEWLRRLGDLTPGELEGPMAAFMHELANDHRAQLIELPRCREPQRWIATEDAELYRQAFGLEGEVAGEDARLAAATILSRFLETHALVGLRDVLDRYPFEPDWAQRQIEDWSRNGRLIAVPSTSTAEPLQWSLPDNLEQVQRGSLALLRREVLTCPPTQFVDFVLHWQGVHSSAQPGSAEGLAATLDRLQGLPLPAELWEQTLLPSRVPGYQPRWLDEWCARGEGTWVCQADAATGPILLAFLRRAQLAAFAPPPLPVEGDALAAGAGQVLERLRQRGASFVSDLAQDLGAMPSAIRAALWVMLRRRLVTNDHFDVVRKGEPRENPETRAVTTRRSFRRSSVTEGRWSLLAWGQPDAETHAVHMAELLLQRYGVVARELALLDPWMPSWRVLYEVLSRMELTGAVRRGYFVEGLSGAQFALPEAAQQLQDLTRPSTATAPVVLLHSLDPANLYGSGAPFDIALLDGGTRTLSRRAGNWLVLRAGRPVLIIEQQGKRLTALASASKDDVTAALVCLPSVLNGRTAKHKLTVEEWNSQPVTATAGKDLLEAVGFVRDYQSMTLYAAWR